MWWLATFAYAGALDCGVTLHDDGQFTFHDQQGTWAEMSNGRFELTTRFEHPAWVYPQEGPWVILEVAGRRCTSVSLASGRAFSICKRAEVIRRFGATGGNVEGCALPQETPSRRELRRR